MEDYNKYNMSMNQTIDYKIRPLCQDESSLLKDFLYEAIFIPKGIEAPSREVINAPELKIYIDYYNNERISLKLKGMSPVQYRTHSQAS